MQLQLKTVERCRNSNRRHRYRRRCCCTNKSSILVFSFFLLVAILTRSDLLLVLGSAPDAAKSMPKPAPKLSAANQKNTANEKPSSGKKNKGNKKKKKKKKKSFWAQLAQRALSPKGAAAVGTVRDILADIQTEHGVVDVFAKYRYREIWTSAVAWSQLQSAAQYYDAATASTTGATTRATTARRLDKINEYNDPDLLDEIAHYAVYASVAYGWKMNLAVSGRWHKGCFSDLELLRQRTGVPVEDVVAARWEATDAHEPSYFVVRDRARKKIVLCVRGTRSTHDVLTDLCCLSQDYDPTTTTAAANNNTEGEPAVAATSSSQPPPGPLPHEDVAHAVRSVWGTLYDTFEDFCAVVIASHRKEKKERYQKQKHRHAAHLGMLKAARAVQCDVEAILRAELAAHPDHKLVLVGHSLGGGVVSILATMWGGDSTGGNGFWGENKAIFPGVKAYVYGAPCVAPLDAFPTGSPDVVSVIREGDPFCCLSLGHLADASLGLSILCEDRTLRRDILRRIENGSSDGGGGRFRRFRSRRNRRPENMEEVDLAWCSRTMAKMRKRIQEESMPTKAEKLFPPGRILLLSSTLATTSCSHGWHQTGMGKNSNSGGDGDSDKEWRLQPVTAQYFQDLIIRPRMFDLRRHNPAFYESCLRQLALDERP